VTGATIALLGPGSRVDIRGAASNGWYPVRCSGQDGWVSAAFITLGTAPTTGEVIPGGGEIWYDINLRTQYMMVYQGNRVIAQSYISSGKPGFDTPTGTFRISRKVPVQTMSGVLGGEYYNVPNVPDVMYFTNVGHAIHGAYWHNAFGTRRSHGCINVPLGLAAWLYQITPMNTRVVIHY
jgi:lipoprotein-anchoring transpeptidase ErfK/SrfK